MRILLWGRHQVAGVLSQSLFLGCVKLRVWREAMLRGQPPPPPPHNCKMLRIEPKVLNTRKETEEIQLPASWQVPSLCIACSPRQITMLYCRNIASLSDAQLRSSSSQGSLIPNKAWKPLQLFHAKTPPGPTLPSKTPNELK
jgi:hypothetical protein